MPVPGAWLEHGRHGCCCRCRDRCRRKGKCRERCTGSLSSTGGGQDSASTQGVVGSREGAVCLHCMASFGVHTHNAALAAKLPSGVDKLVGYGALPLSVFVVGEDNVGVGWCEWVWAGGCVCSELFLSVAVVGVDNVDVQCSSV